MKPLLLAAALMVSGAAFAQQTMPANQDANTSTGVNSTTTNQSMTPDAGMSQTDTGMSSSTTTATDPSMASPAPTTGTMSNGMSSMPSGGAENYPVCSRSVTDRCIQSGATTRSSRMMHRRR